MNRLILIFVGILIVNACIEEKKLILGNWSLIGVNSLHEEFDSTDWGLANYLEVKKKTIIITPVNSRDKIKGRYRIFRKDNGLYIKLSNSEKEWINATYELELNYLGEENKGRSKKYELLIKSDSMEMYAIKYDVKFPNPF